MACDRPSRRREDGVKAALKELPAAIKDVTGLVKKNRIFNDRASGIGAIGADEAINYGFTGPCLRASGVDHDLRKKHPYYGYENFDFDVPIGENGDTYDRLFVRVEEMWQSLRIIEQALKKLPKGPINIDDKKVMLPPKHEVHTSMEAMINHFKLVIEGIQPPAGEIYDVTESPNGELGFYVISDGGAHPYRIKVRPPCFYTMAALKRLIEGGMVADIVAILGGLNVIAGELDR